MRENVKKKADGASTWREEPIPNLGEDDEFWDNLKINNEAPTYHEKEAPTQEGHNSHHVN